MSLSIVIPTLNNEKKLDQCLRSLSHQLSGNDEVIILDEGSQDGTLEVAYTHGAKVILCPESSIGGRRNFGTEISKNEIIVQADADCVFPENHIQKVKTYFAENQNLVGVCGPLIDSKQRPLRLISDPIVSLILQGMGGNTVYRKWAFYKTKGYSDARNFHDTDFWAQLKNVGITLYDPNFIVWHDTESLYWTSLPSYIVGGSLLGAGATYEGMIGGEIGSATMGLGTGFVLGQLGVDLGINKDAPPDHFHHWMLGLMIIAGAMTFGDVLGDDVEAGLYGLGSGLFLHDVLTEATS